MRQCQQLLQQAKLIHDFQGRRVNGIAAKVAQEIGVLFQHYDLYPRPGQQIAEHQPGGATANDAAGGSVRCDRWL
ncbi:hypothetical protein D3C78_1462710 [compost metagenome]